MVGISEFGYSIICILCKYDFQNIDYGYVNEETEEYFWTNDIIGFEA